MAWIRDGSRKATSLFGLDGLETIPSVMEAHP
ncbi:protein of unknown function [Ralstonia solanacearum CFBP2957]|nr:protein of unknown function [Ralstonia solanacearum CFBP2957]